ALDLAAEHVERQHVEEDVRDVAVQEAVGDQLPQLEARLVAARRPEREHRERIDQQEGRDVRDQQPLRNRGQSYSTFAPESRTSFSQQGASALTSAPNAPG